MKMYLFANMLFFIGLSCGMNENLSGIEVEKTCILPEILFEVSSATDVDDHTVAVVQDEKGVVFFYNFVSCVIERTLTFAGDGDYEGITRVENDLYVLRSDGRLFQIKNYTEESPVVESFETHIPAEDIEGLSYDERKDILLIVPKRKYHDKEFAQKYSAVYAYNLKNKKMMSEPYITIEKKQIAKAILKVKALKSGKIKYYFSSITSDPEQDFLYLLMSKDYVILKVDYEGKIHDVMPIDKEQFPKPEGLTFITPEKLILTSEGKKEQPAQAARIRFLD